MLSRLCRMHHSQSVIIDQGCASWTLTGLSCSYALIISLNLLLDTNYGAAFPHRQGPSKSTLHLLLHCSCIFLSKIITHLYPELKSDVYPWIFSLLTSKLHSTAQQETRHCALLRMFISLWKHCLQLRLQKLLCKCKQITTKLWTVKSALVTFVWLTALLKNRQANNLSSKFALFQIAEKIRIMPNPAYCCLAFKLAKFNLYYICA